ncbi:hypothetical protein ILUMI_14258 [Ignelater luminosus]|uniref:Reverse transcriptase Ty1/copia-type domain-containing protein n=1 Tax=Ignelater luminosus TaxID=2038154 RepID=A0A8K0G510_IGNLU|nr:hypothetical protein ILUMI_14258 [Ignelater luminosus]
MARTFKYSSSEASFPEALWAELVAKSSKEGVSPHELWTSQCEEHVKLPVKDIERPNEGKKNTQGKDDFMSETRDQSESSEEEDLSDCDFEPPEDYEEPLEALSKNVRDRSSLQKPKIYEDFVMTNENIMTETETPDSYYDAVNGKDSYHWIKSCSRWKRMIHGKLALYLKEVKPPHAKFKVTAKKTLYFLGLEIERSEDGSAKICQQAYAQKILERFGFQDCKPVSTPMTKEPENSKPIRESDKGSDFLYRQAVGALMYLMVGTRPDLVFSVSFLSRSLD